MCLCALENLFGVIGKKWYLVILEEIEKNKKIRFRDLYSKFEGISPSILTSSLKNLEKNGIIQRKLYQEIPLRVEYSLSEKGEELRKVLTPLIEWSQMNFKDENICRCNKVEKLDSSLESDRKFKKVIEASMCTCIGMAMMVCCNMLGIPIF